MSKRQGISFLGGFLLMLGTLFAVAELPANAVWIDVRTPAEYDAGHLPGATLIPYDGIEKGIKALDLGKDTPIYLYCAAGGRAEKARQQLLRMEYTNVTNAGGLADARELLTSDPADGL